MQISGTIVDIVAEKIFPAKVEIENGRVRGVVETSRVDAGYLLPGFVDAHVHVESSMLTPARFAELAVVHGTVAVVSDPHEIANVLGAAGVLFMLENAAGVPLRFCFGAPSCVPATPFETAGGLLSAHDIERFFREKRLAYLAEVMNVPGVLAGDAEIGAKLAAARRYRLPVDGHAPGLRGEALARYVAAGISTDHETLTVAEGEEKIGLGMKLLLRQGSAAKNLRELLPLLDRYPGMCMLCSDDLHPDDLARGHINLLVQQALAEGAGLFSTLRAASYTPARHYGLPRAGFAAGDRADFIRVTNLSDFQVMETWISGRAVARNGRALFSPGCSAAPNRFACSTKEAADFRVEVGDGLLRVIEVADGSLVTAERLLPPLVHGGLVCPDPSRDLVKLAVVNRYAEAPPALAFASGFGLQRGAFASSVAHDSHNIIAAGCDDASLCRAVNLIIGARGGLAVVAEGEELLLPLPVAGLMSADDGHRVARRYAELDRFVKRLGSPLHAPFMTLSFMALPVIPALKLTDRGLFDARDFAFIPLLSGGE